jgi:hypothetical protein
VAEAKKLTLGPQGVLVQAECYSKAHQIGLDVLVRVERNKAGSQN